MKFLNKDGVSRLWTNILATFIPKDSIANSLDINDSSKVLSAAQGPIISTALNNLEDRVDNLDVANPIPEDTINSIIGEVTTPAEAISV